MNFFFQLIVDYKQHFDTGGPKFQYHINASIDGVYFNRLFDPGGTTISSFLSPPFQHRNNNALEPIDSLD
eukprot:2070243-Ditylum_brightwellii.AAC.1